MFPPGFLSSIGHAAGFEEGSFVQAHQAAAPPVSIRVNLSKADMSAHTMYKGMEKIPWCPTGYYLPERPVFTLDPLLHAGAYYVQEASSMFLEQAIREACHNITIHQALDLCAAPGGKSTHLLSLLPGDAVLVSNEVIHPRTSILLENVTKWGSTRSVVTQNDPADFGKLGPVFDLMVVDAPCSGSGLFRRDPEAMKEWGLQTVELCAQRQQRILADALPSLKAGGYLVYATCSYSPDEDEKILDWLLSGFELEGVALDWAGGKDGVVVTRSPEKNAPCYRFFPDKVKGEGFFMALLRKGGDDAPVLKKALKSKTVADKVPEGLRPWIKAPEDYVYYRYNETIYLMHPAVWSFFQPWRESLNIRKAGVKLAEEAHGKFNPSHDFALSTALQKEAFTVLNVSRATALSFLRKEEFEIPGETLKGWVLVVFEGLPIGWLKNMGNRMNNYYPKEWRIRMSGSG